jgi:hypothetical protein
VVELVHCAVLATEEEELVDASVAVIDRLGKSPSAMWGGREAERGGNKKGKVPGGNIAAAGSAETR